MFYTALHPLRPRDWRWERAKAIVLAGTTPSQLDDEAVVRAYQYQFRNEKLKAQRDTKANEQDKIKLIEDFPLLYMANEINEQRNYLKWALEALIVSRSTAEEIAKRIPGGTTELIQEYEAMFFDVRDRLGYRIWVLNELIGAILEGGLKTNPDIYWKAIGYFFGPVALEEYWQLGRLSPESKQGMDDVIQGVMRRRALEAQMVRPVDKYTAPSIMMEYMELVKAEKVENMGRQDTGQEQSAQIIMQSLQAAGTLLTLQDVSSKTELRAGESLHQLIGETAQAPENVVAKQDAPATIMVTESAVPTAPPLPAAP
jgi:hypothetical protein